MSDILVTIFVGIILLVAAFGIPMLATLNQNDEITESSVKAIVQEFVNKEASKGKITLEDYEAFLQRLNATGNTYDVALEVQVMGDNVGVKGSAGTTVNVIGENIRHSEFTTTILNSLNSESQYLLNKGDYFIVSVKNTNVTLSKQIQAFFYQIVGKDTTIIDTSANALVSVTGVK